ncbi:hypothetical protein [Thaumasiovibrio sp. DFM-14]|uniref:hypothetical protein n=1 Tax=Thaumasiovibrio sp. DFM-14 TaxID=3384792 RepID=UPI0039A25565
MLYRKALSAFAIMSFVIVSLVSVPALAEIRTPMTFPGRDDLIYDIIHLALEKSNAPQSLIPSSEYYSDARLVEEVRNGDVDLIWAGASTELQSQLKAIKIPIFKGLSGYRTFVIERSQQKLFDNITNLEQLKARTAGLGRFWTDTLILEAAGITVIKPVKADSLFYMLDGHRFDYLPLGVHESQGVVDTQQADGLNLVLESKLLLKYPSAMYFYVEKNNQQLYDLLNSGLEKAISDGSYDELFYRSEIIRKTIINSNINGRRVIEINNPFLPDDMPLHREELWLDTER